MPLLTAEQSILQIQPDVMFVKMDSSELGTQQDVTQEIFRMSLYLVLKQTMLLTRIQTYVVLSVLQVNMLMQQLSFVYHVVTLQLEEFPIAILADMRMEILFV